MTGDLTTIPVLLRTRARVSGHRTALVHDDVSISYSELDTRTRALAGSLVAAGVTKAARIGLLMPNGIDWAIVAYATARIGAVLVPLSTLLRAPELESQLRGASVTHLITVATYRGRSYLDELTGLDPQLGAIGTTVARHPRLPALRQIWRSDQLPTAALPDGIVEALEEPVRPADDLAIMFTSGSRGAPKGVVHTHGNALRAVASGLEDRCIGPGERLYIPMPFFWMGGFAGGLLSALVADATLLTESDPTPARTIAFLERERATLFRGWPDQAVRIASDPAFASADLSTLRAGSLDAVLPPERRGRPGTRANLFGMTETFGPYCGSRLDTDLPEAARGSCGRPFAGIEVRIVDPDDGQPVAAGEHGEIAVRGPNVMRGINRRLRADTFTSDGFYRTGDLGSLVDGYLFYAGRTDDMFKVSGATVYPPEVEAALRASPLVAQAYVTNLSEATGEAVGAAVVTSAPVTIAELEADARARLSSFKVPTRWVIVDSPDAVPTMATGKVDKAALQALIRADQDPAP